MRHKLVFIIALIILVTGCDTSDNHSGTQLSSATVERAQQAVINPTRGATQVVAGDQYAEYDAQRGEFEPDVIEHNYHPDDEVDPLPSVSVLPEDDADQALLKDDSGRLDVDRDDVENAHLHIERGDRQENDFDDRNAERE